MCPFFIFLKLYLTAVEAKKVLNEKFINILENFNSKFNELKILECNDFTNTDLIFAASHNILLFMFNEYLSDINTKRFVFCKIENKVN